MESVSNVLLAAASNATATDLNSTVSTTITDTTAIDDVISKVSIVLLPLLETKFEYGLDIFLGLCFLMTTIVAAKRMLWSRKQGGLETTVVTAFYSLILMTSILRTFWFLIPKTLLKPAYTPSAVMAFDSHYSDWVGAFFFEILLSVGSLCLFSIFILILVYWADILKKYFYPGARRSKPMVTFLTLVSLLGSIVLANCILFLLRLYSVEGMILINALLLSSVSIICVIEISIFSHRFRTVLKTLGAINQVSTESQVKRIVWITITGNLFFFTRAFLETIMCFMLVLYWHQYGNVDRIFSHALWDTYIILKHGSEVIILCLMLYILQSRFTTNVTMSQGMDRGGYESVGDGDDVFKPKVTTGITV